MNSSDNKLYKLPDDAMVSGVCAGLAKHLEVDVSVVRAVFVGLTVFSGFGLAAYLALWFLLDNAPAEETSDETESGSRHTDLPLDPIVIADAEVNVDVEVDSSSN